LCAARVRTAKLKMPGNSFAHAIDVGQNLLVPEAQHSIVLALKILRPAFIALPFAFIAMLVSVKLDNEPCIGTEEICDERTNRVLPPEFVACEVSISKTAPEDAFAVGRVFAEITGVSH